MSLLTRCTRCRTLFRVTPAQLQARGGKVRCGRCMNVFDGFQALTVQDVEAASEPVRFEERPEETPTPATPPSAPPETANDKVPRFSDALNAAREPAPAAARPQPQPSAATETHHDATAPPVPWWRGNPLASTSPNRLWGAGCALAFVLLAFQVIYAGRGELAARHPELRAFFTSLCAHVGCTIPFPHDPTLVRIEASDVRMVDISRPQLVQLTATLRSYAGYYVAYPALDLVLTNANEHALARRVFVPREYLGSNRDPKVGFAPHAEITIALDLDTGNQNAAGFRLDLLAAP
jgi:predicted Zn finger-like uncharacterized protein